MGRPFIVCGMGEVGYRIVELLHRLGEEVVAITESASGERQAAAAAAGVRVLLGDARSEALLAEAGLAHAQAVIAATDRDLINIAIGLDVHRWRPDVPVVLRLFDQTLARQLETSFSFRRALGMSALAAPSFAAAALGESVICTWNTGDLALVVGQLAALPDGAPLPGRVGDLPGRVRLLCLARERGGAVLPAPTADEGIEAGDRLVVLGLHKDWDLLAAAARHREPPAGLWHRLTEWGKTVWETWSETSAVLRAFLKGLLLLLALSVFVFHYGMGLTFLDALYFAITTVTTTGYGDISARGAGPFTKIYAILMMVLGSATVAVIYSLITDILIQERFRKALGGPRMPRQGHVVVAGLGRVGYRIVLEIQKAGVPVVAIEADAHGPFVAGTRPQAPVVTGDARFPDVLARAHVETARAIIAATGDDAANLGIALVARRANPEVRVVSRLFDADFARRVESVLAIDATLGPARLAAPSFVAAALYADAAQAFLAGDRLFVLLDRQAGEEWESQTPSELCRKAGVQILLRGGELLAECTAHGDRPLAAGEHVLAAAWRQLAPAWGAATATQ